MTIDPPSGSPPAQPISVQRWRAAAYWLMLALLVTAIWSAYYRRWPGTERFRAPVQYSGDGYAAMGIARGFAEFPVPWNIEVKRLNAPYSANWNDYPLPDKLIWYFGGAVMRCFEAGTAANVILLTSHLLAALGFAWAARRMGAGSVGAATTSLLYSFSPYMLGRSLAHLPLTFTWHLPLAVWFLWYSTTKGPSFSISARLGGFALFIVAALQNPYYALLIFQLTALALVGAVLLRKRQAALFIGLPLAAGVAMFVLDQANVLLYTHAHGPNFSGATRDLASLIQYGLRLPDLILPGYHPIKLLRDFAQLHYFANGALINENQLAYLGLAGIVCVIALGVVSLTHGLQGRFQSIPLEAWIFLYTLLFAVTGGLDYLLGSFGFVWLRAGNRYSVMLLCLAFLWACRSFDIARRPWIREVLLSILLVIGLWEAFALRPEWVLRWQDEDAIRATSDRIFTRRVEKALPSAASVFEIPAMDFPEAPRICNMSDYEPLRPYLWSQHLRFSYGTVKGRSREIWQQEIGNLSAEEQVTFLSHHNFDAIIINRNGLADNGADFERTLQRLGMPKIAESSLGELIAYRIQNQGNAPLPIATTVLLAQGWWGWETANNTHWSWSKGDASLILVADPNPARMLYVEFQLGADRDQDITIEIAGRTVKQIHLHAGMIESAEIPWRIERAETELRLLSSMPATRPPNGDPRLLGFRVIQPLIKEPAAAK